MINYVTDKAKELPIHKGQRLYAAVTDKRGRIIGEGSNSYSKSHPYQAACAKEAGECESIFLHAEITAIVRCKGGEPHTLYVARVNRKGQPLLSKPCPICQIAIEQAGIKNIFYTR